MKKFVLTMILAVLVLSHSNANAFERNDFSKHMNQELYVTVETPFRSRTILLYLTEVNEYEIAGPSNDGKVHIPIGSILFYTEQKDGIQGVLNHNQ